MHALSINNVSKSYGRVEVLKNIDINIDAGEFLILVGPSGCGKSTLLSLIAGLDEVTSGSISIGERDVTHLTPKDRDIAMVFQSYALYPNKTVRGNIEFGLKIRGMPKQEINETIERVAALLQIEDLLDRKPSQLSGGQRQRVAMGRAISRNPSLYLFDEPLSNLDAKLRVEMRAEIKLLHQRVKTSTVYVTHDQVEAMTLGDRIAVMKGGIIQQFGTPEEVYTRPKNMFVASFMGSPAMNFIPVTIDSEGKSFTLKTKAEEKTFPVLGDHPAMSAYKGKEVVLGLRPEDFTNADEKNTHTIKVPLELNEFTGADLMAYTYFNDSRVICRCDPGQSKGLEALDLGLRLSNSLFYDKETEALIE